MFNPGSVVVSLDGFNFATDTTGGGNNIYNKFTAALETGKPVVLKDFVVDDVTSGTSSPAPATITRLDSGVLQVHTSFAVFAVDDTNSIEVIATIPTSGE